MHSQLKDGIRIYFRGNLSQLKLPGANDTRPSECALTTVLVTYKLVFSIPGRHYWISLQHPVYHSHLPN